MKILIADAHRLFREGLRALLEDEPGLRVVAEAANGREALKLEAVHKPDLVLLELEMPGLAGMEVLRRLHIVEGMPRVILMAAVTELEQIREAFLLGARGILLKESATTVLFKCIEAVGAGMYWVSTESAADFSYLLEKADELRRRQPQSRDFGLTKREREILSAVVLGKTNRILSQEFAISEQTVKHHVTHIFDKTGVYNRLELALFAIHHGLVRKSEVEPDNAARGKKARKKR